jgi:tetratricopeptide (TPR) repeat protein
MAEVDLLRGRPAEAEVALRACLAADPHHARAHHVLGLLLSERGELLAALEAFGRATEARPGLVEAWRRRGETHQKLGQAARAMADLERADRLARARIQGWVDSGRALARKGALDEAAQAARAALALWPGSAEARLLEARIAALRGRMTLIVISHRLSVLRRADQIYVFDAGRVVERGTHESLLIKDGIYAAMLRTSQMSLA